MKMMQLFGAVMNEALRELVLAAGAPEELIDDLWFHLFCQKFAHLIIQEMEVHHE
jgi:hypothetical protein